MIPPNLLRAFSWVGLLAISPLVANTSPESQKSPAQQGCRLIVQVTSSTGTPIQGAKITISDDGYIVEKATGKITLVKSKFSPPIFSNFLNSDSNGFATFNGINEQCNVLQIEKIGYKYELFIIKLDTQKSTELKYSLKSIPQ